MYLPSGGLQSDSFEQKGIADAVHPNDDQQTIMSARTIAICSACGQGYVARQRDDDSFILATEDGRCQCGNETLRELPEAARSVEDV